MHGSSTLENLSSLVDLKSGAMNLKTSDLYDSFKTDTPWWRWNVMILIKVVPMVRFWMNVGSLTFINTT